MFGSLRSRIAISNLIITLFGLLALMFVFFQLLQQQAVSVEQSDVRRQAAQLRTDVETEQSLPVSPAQTYAYLSHDSQLLNKQIISLPIPMGFARSTQPYICQKARGPSSRALSRAMKPVQGSAATVKTANAVSQGRQAGREDVYLVYQESLSRSTGSPPVPWYW